MAGIIVADTIQSGGSFIRLNSASQTVATINAAGIYANTGNLLIAANGTIGVASITNTAITGTITQAQIGNGVAGTGPAFKANLSGTQTISSGVWTKYAGATESFDTASCYDNATNYRFTPNVAGYYYVKFANWFTSGTSVVAASIYKNGSAALIEYDYQAGGLTVRADGLIFMNGTTDYLEAFVFQSSGGNLTLDGSSVNPGFSAFLFRAT